MGSVTREVEPFVALGRSVVSRLKEQETGAGDRRQGCSPHCGGTQDSLSSIIHSFILVET